MIIKVTVNIADATKTESVLVSSPHMFYFLKYIQYKELSVNGMTIKKVTTMPKSVIRTNKLFNINYDIIFKFITNFISIYNDFKKNKNLFTEIIKHKKELIMLNRHKDYDWCLTSLELTYESLVALKKFPVLLPEVSSSQTEVQQE